MQILVVDDQASARRILQRLLKPVKEAVIHEAASLAEALSVIDSHLIDVALVDIRLAENTQNRDGHKLIQEISRRQSTVSIVVSGLNQMEEIREAMRSGAYDYIIKDALCEEMIVPIIENLRHHRMLKSEVQELRARSSGGIPSNFVPGTSTVMKELFNLIQRVALSDRPVLITGPTGSGKELVVEAIHRLGANPDSPLLDINCGSIPANLIESQLFGHEKGAFTGAMTHQEGYFGAVRNGTLFLDEIAELPLPLQPGLLRVIETRTYRPVGSTRELPFKGRIAAATHADLDRNVRDGTFREDLFYRLNILTLKVPALIEHREDIPALIVFFAENQPRPLKFTDDAVAALMQFDWPGNVRQLRTVIDRIAVLSDDHPVTAETVQSFITSPIDSTSEILDAVAGSLIRLDLENSHSGIIKAMENALIMRAMKEAGGNKSAAAKLLGVHRKYIERRQ